MVIKTTYTVKRNRGRKGKKWMDEIQKYWENYNLYHQAQYKHRCQPSHNHAGNPAFCLVSRNPAMSHIFRLIAKKTIFSENRDVFQRHEDILSTEAVQKLAQRTPTMEGHIPRFATIERGAIWHFMRLFRFCARVPIDVHLVQGLQNGNTC